jgi:guanyl-specific ribonuclease Sa
MPVRPPRRPRAALLLALPAAACASGAAGREPLADPTANIPTTTRIETMTGTSEVRTVSNSVAATEAELTATPAKAFAVLPTVFEALGLPFNTAISDAGTFGAREMRMPRRLGKTPLSYYVDCGTSATGTPNADQYAVSMTVLSRVVAAPAGGSTVSTQLVATARPITVSGNPVRCSSNGRLEQAINRRLILEAAR